MVDAHMDCPACGTRMISGRTKVQKTRVGCFLSGADLFFREHLWFRDEQGKIQIMKSNDARAYRCRKCGTVVIQDEDWLIENAYAAESSGDTKRALVLYRISVEVGIDVDHARVRIHVLESQGKSLVEHLDELYLKYGYHGERLVTIRMEGSDGMRRMDALMEKFRVATPAELGGLQVVSMRDYQNLTRTMMAGGQDSISGPVGNLLIFETEKPGNYVAARPSGKRWKTPGS